ncbi:MAG: hypothetical protein B7Z78_06955 [Rhodospirillales bacterium 20-60-12]|nr:MAG: hypothetical protein B7Z78_06955 [Rhodospirillales bacterium 20-60-12]HQT67175.1 lysophospholipid acyltransferase family protein [Acetobacteraceae bacterium]
MLKRWLQTPWMQSLLARAAGRYLRFVARSTRWRIEADEALAALAAQRPAIFAFWHETLPSMPILLLRAAPAGGARYILVSRHRDGQFIGTAMKALGLTTIDGSSSRGGTAGLLGMVKKLRAGAAVALTPDGPRGPRQVAAPGIAQLAALSGAPVFACASFTSRALRLNSWDRMAIPLPFGRGALVCSGPIMVGRHDAAAALPLIERAMIDALGRAAA